MEQKQAKKDFRKLLKKYNIEKTLQQEENFDKFYDNLKSGNETKEKEEELPKGYMSWEEFRFYGDDTDFMKFHKRTKQNMKDSLQELISSSR
jgi:hypothetical protein